MGEPIELQGELETFFDSLLSSLPPTATQQDSGPALKSNLFSLCKLDGPDDQERVRDALRHTHQVAEAMEIMTGAVKWERLSSGELFKFLAQEVEEVSSNAAASQKEEEVRRVLGPVREAAGSIDPYQMTLALTHDLGKLRTRRQHEFESAEMLARERLLERLGVPSDSALVMEAAIKYHLILPSIFTGSYSLLSFLPVKDDPLVKKIEERGLTGRFLDALYLISVADVAGLGKMTTIKIDNFDLRGVLQSAFELNGGDFRKKLYELDRERVVTRLASLRCFNKMELKHQDLRHFEDCAREAGEALLAMEGFGVDRAAWEEFIDFLPRMANFGYSIGLIYTFGATGDDGVPGSQKKISPRLFGLLVALSRLMREKERVEGWDNPLWELSILNHPGFFDAKFKQLMAWMVRDGNIDRLLSPDRITWGENEGAKVLAVDFRGLPPS